MAHILSMNVSDFGAKLDSIVNVTQKVGPKSENCPNLQNDVDAVEKLMLIWDSQPQDGQNINNNGIFDPVTGYGIYRTQQRLKSKWGKTSQIVDGIVSPAKGVGYGGLSIYTIVMLNLLAKHHNPEGYEKFRRTFVCKG